MSDTPLSERIRNLAGWFDPEFAPEAQVVNDLANEVRDMENTIDGMTEEWGVEATAHPFGLRWEWYDNEATAQKAQEYEVDIWRAGNRQKVRPIRRRLIAEVTDND